MFLTPLTLHNFNHNSMHILGTTNSSIKKNSFQKFKEFIMSEYVQLGLQTKHNILTKALGMFPIIVIYCLNLNLK